MLVLALTLLAGTPAAPPRDTILVQAQAALERGNPWQAYRLLLPRTRVARTRTPETVWLAAQAAAGWGGWPQVRSLLARERWLDSRYQGGGLELLARASLALGDDSGAARQSRRALAAAHDDSTRGVRRVLLARALDRQGLLPDAYEAYLRAAGELPAVADWLTLRAATTAPDPARRGELLARLGSPLALRRAPSSLALAFAARQEWALARDAWYVAGDSTEGLLAAIRLAARPEYRAPLLAALDRARADQLPRLLSAFDDAYAPLTADEQLVMARAATRAGDARRAVTGFQRAPHPLAPDDQWRYGTALLRLGRPRDAEKVFATVDGPGGLMARAWYDRARALSRLGLGDSARAMLRTLPDRFPAESVAGNALALAADLAVDRGDDSTARALWLRLADQLPASRFAPYARFEAALTRYVAGDPAGAAAEFDALASRPGPEAMAATYWAGRALAETGDSAGAMLRWRTVATVAPETYYALLAGRRLGLVPWAPGGTPDLAPRGAAAAATRRILLLERLGLDLEAGWEADELANANGDAAWLLDAARALAAVGRSAPAARLARRAIAAGTADTVTAYYLIYPVLHADVLGAESETRGLDPAFTAALIRQESTFDPEAVSGAGARGLMQVMPEVGRRLARQLRWPLWDPVLLFQPDVSLELGHFHLKNLFDRYRGESNVLVAYNAGGGRIAPWRARPGADDPEVFIERIPYAETRDYVRIVLRNAEYYRRMYDWTCGSGDDVPPEDRVAETGVRVLSCS